MHRELVGKSLNAAAIVLAVLLLAVVPAGADDSQVGVRAVCPDHDEVPASVVLFYERIERIRVHIADAQPAQPVRIDPSLDADVATLQAFAAELAAAHGWTGTELDALNELVHRESSWNARADNPMSTAFGLFQFLRQTAIDYGIDHPDLNDTTPTVRTQIESGLRYIADRYGTPSAALRFHTANGWY